MNPGDKTLEQRLGELILALGVDVKALRNKDVAIETTIGDLANLTSDQKGSIVAAINEVLAIAKTGSSVIDDNALPVAFDKTYSVAKILTMLADLRSEIMGGLPPSTLDTIKEIADWIANDETAMSGILSSLGKRVAVDTAQTFTATEQAQGRSNIGAQEAAAIGDTNTDLVALYNTAKA